MNIKLGKRMKKKIIHSSLIIYYKITIEMMMLERRDKIRLLR